MPLQFHIHKKSLETLGDFSIDLDEEAGISVETNEVSFELSFNFAFKMLVYPYTFDSADILLTADQTAVFLNASFYSENHCEYFDVSTINLTFGEFDMTSNDVSDLFSDILSAVSSVLAVALEEEVNTQLSAMLNEVVEGFMACSHCVISDQVNGIYIDNRMTFDPPIYDGYYTQPFSQIFYDGSQEGFYQVDPDTYTEMPTIIDSSDLQIIMKPDFLASAFHAYNRIDGFFHYEIEANDLTNFPFPFTLATLEQMFSSLPQCVSSLPDSTPLRAVFDLGSDPDVSMMPGALSVTTNDFVISLQVQDTQGTCSSAGSSSSSSSSSTDSWVEVVSAPLEVIIAA
ncbi:hypothetical protein ADUPG1_009007, partial [Aduncisulcus paluster]